MIGACTKPETATSTIRYQQLDSLREYILVDSEQVHATRLARMEGSDTWTIELYDNIEAVLPFTSIGCEIPLRRIYNKVEFESGA